MENVQGFKNCGYTPEVAFYEVITECQESLITLMRTINGATHTALFHGIDWETVSEYKKFQEMLAAIS